MRLQPPERQLEGGMGLVEQVERVPEGADLVAPIEPG
jgi:hypothetical protein